MEKLIIQGCRWGNKTCGEAWLANCEPLFPHIVHTTAFLSPIPTQHNPFKIFSSASSDPRTTWDYQSLAKFWKQNQSGMGNQTQNWMIFSKSKMLLNFEHFAPIEGAESFQIPGMFIHYDTLEGKGWMKGGQVKWSCLARVRNQC